MITLSKYKALEVIQDTKGKIFFCIFIKKDGSQREMTARLGVSKNLKGGKNGAGYHNSLITVFDMVAGAYRMINLETLTTLKVSGNSYQVV